MSNQDSDSERPLTLNVRSYAHEKDTADLQAMFKIIIARLDAIDEVIESPPFRPFNLAPLSDESRAKLEKEQEERQTKAESLEQQQKLLALQTMALVERVVVALEKFSAATEHLAEAAKSIEKYGLALHNRA
jgi:hypothetical protein